MSKMRRSFSPRIDNVEIEQLIAFDGMITPFRFVPAISAVMVAAFGFVGGLPLISTNLFAQDVPPTRVPVGPPVFFNPGN